MLLHFQWVQWGLTGAMGGLLGLCPGPAPHGARTSGASLALCKQTRAVTSLHISSAIQHTQYMRPAEF
jgi:hypothetical protein